MAVHQHEVQLFIYHYQQTYSSFDFYTLFHITFAAHSIRQKSVFKTSWFTYFSNTSTWPLEFTEWPLDFGIEGQSDPKFSIL